MFHFFQPLFHYYFMYVLSFLGLQMYLFENIYYYLKNLR